MHIENCIRHKNEFRYYLLKNPDRFMFSNSTDEETTVYFNDKINNLILDYNDA